jgi:hypothetical protein
MPVLTNPQSPTPSPEELYQKALDDIDEFLQKIQTGATVSTFTFTSYMSTSSIMREIIDKYGLVHYRNPGNKTSLVELSTEGLKAVKVGIREYMNPHVERAKKQEEIVDLTHEQLRMDQFPKKFWMVIIIITAVISGLIQYIINMLSNR